MSLIKFIILVISILTTNLTAAKVAEIKRDPFQPPTKIAFNPTITLKNLKIVIHYAKAEDIAKMLLNKNADLLSTAGAINVDKRTNALWIQDTSENLHKIEQFIKITDIPAMQVIITAKIVNVNESFSRELGLAFGTTENNLKDNNGLSMDLPDTNFNIGHANLVIAKLPNNILLETELAALQSEGKGQVISSPKLITLDRQAAYIESGEEVPYQEKTGQGDTSVTFKKAVLGLKVTPEIINTKQIALNIEVNQDKVEPTLVNGEPAISTRQIKTQVIVENKQTIVLGGVYEENKNKITTRVPILGSIPILGLLFTQQNSTNERRELLIFITPEIK